MTTPKTSAPEWAASQATPHTTVNEALRRIEAGAGLFRVEDDDATAPPGSCADGAQYIPAATATGAWTGKEKNIAIAVGVNAANGWYFIAPEEGMRARIKDENVFKEYDGSAWSAAASGVGDLVAANNLSDVADPATAGANIRPVESMIIACGDESTAVTTGTGKVTFRMPYAFTLTAVRASVKTAPTGSTIIIDINEAGSTILSTKLSIDASEKTSTTAASAAVISDATLADDAEMTIDFDQVGSTIAGAGVKVALIGHRA